MKDMKDYSQRLAVAIRDHRNLGDEDLRDSLAVHFPEKAERLDAYQEALDARSAAEVDLRGYCIQQLPGQTLSTCPGKSPTSPSNWQRQFADGRAPPDGSRRRPLSGGSEALLAALRQQRQCSRKSFSDGWMSSPSSDERILSSSVIWQAAGRHLNVATIAARHPIRNHIKPRSYVPGPRCDLCRGITRTESPVTGWMIVRQPNRVEGT